MRLLKQIKKSHFYSLRLSCKYCIVVINRAVSNLFAMAQSYLKHKPVPTTDTALQLLEIQIFFLDIECVIKEIQLEKT